VACLEKLLERGILGFLTAKKCQSLQCGFWILECSNGWILLTPRRLQVIFKVTSKSSSISPRPAQLQSPSSAFPTNFSPSDAGVKYQPSLPSTYPRNSLSLLAHLCSSTPAALAAKIALTSTNAP
jgi:hypothetical protein